MALEGNIAETTFGRDFCMITVHVEGQLHIVNEIILIAERTFDFGAQLVVMKNVVVDCSDLAALLQLTLQTITVLPLDVAVHFKEIVVVRSPASN